MKRNEKKGAIEGRITDKKSGKPLYGVNVAVDGKDISTRTDIRGRFTIPNVASGTCTLKCDLKGYKPTTGLKMKIEHDRISRCDCQLVPRGTISLNEPVVLLPLRLEIRKHTILNKGTDSPINVTKYAARASVDTIATPRKFTPFEVKSQFEPLNIQKDEYWIRWYSDDFHYLTPVGKITEEEKVSWEQFYEIYTSQKDLGSVKGLYGREPYNLTMESLEIFYGIRPGLLSVDEKSHCVAYDEAASILIIEEGMGVREVLGWQDTKNPKIKSGWMEFAKTFGPVRARQIAKAVLDENWDYDSENDEEDPMDILMDHGISLPTLPEEINLYTINGTKVERLLGNITISRKDLLVAPTDLEGAHWMTDFRKAVAAGMGTIIEDPKKIAQIDKADWLIAVGINDTSDSRNVLEEIFRRNNASGELAVLPQDSPTNNTESISTPYAGLEFEAEEYLRNTRMRIPTEEVPIGLSAQLKTNILDAHKLTSVFKLASDTLSEMPEADLTEMIEADAMAALLWTPCTMLFEKTWGKEFRKHFPTDAQASLKFNIGRFFTQNVRARGTLPIIRVGENPYGILPAVSLRDWCENLSQNKDILGQGTEIICAAINTLKSTFLKLSENTPRVDAAEDEIYEKLLEMLRFSPVSKRVDVRAFDVKKPEDMSEDPKYLSCALVKDKIPENEVKENIIHPETAYLDDLSRINRTDFNPSCFQIDKTSPLLKRIIKHFLWQIFGDANEPSKCGIQGKVIDKETGQILANATVKIKGVESFGSTNKQGDFVFSDVPPGVHDVEIVHPDYKGLLKANFVVSANTQSKVDFKLSPKVLPAANSDNSTKSSNKVSEKSIKAISGTLLDGKSGRVVKGALVHLKGTSKSVLTDDKGKYTFDNLPTGDYKVVTSMANYDTSSFSFKIDDLSPVMEINSSLSPVTEYTNENVNAAAAGALIIPGGLELIADAANLLKRIHPDKVEILLVETLDLLSHRLDAWLTGLANSQLNECLRKNKESPPVGVYGWLEKPGVLNIAPPKPEFIQAPSVKQATTAAILRNASIHNGTDDNSGAFQVNLSSSQVRKGMWYLESLRQGHLPGEILGYRLERIIHEESRNGTSQITDSDVFDLRIKYPLSLHENKDETDESISDLTIIDGEKFLNDKGTESKYKDIKNQLNQIKDAATDIAMCEVINADDNIARRGGWLDFLDGECLPPPEEFIRSQRTGDVHGTKVFLQIPSPDNIEVDKASTNPRMIADPILAHFCEKLMPDFGLKEIEVKLTNVNLKQSRPMTFFARELNMDAIDLVIGGVEELMLRIRYYLLSCWRAHDPTDTSSAHPCAILGPFPDFEKSDDLLYEFGIEIIHPLSSSDTLSIFTYIEKARSIRNLIHKNKSKNSLGTVHPNELPIVKYDQLENLDPLAGFELLSKRLRRIRNQLVVLISKTVGATSKLKGSHITLKGLQECKSAVQVLKEKLLSAENTANSIEVIDLFTAKFFNLLESDSNLKILAEGSQLLDQINQLKDDDSRITNQIEVINTGFRDLENKFNVQIESSAKELVTNANIPLFEISQFGLEKALTIFPDNPTVANSIKITKLFDQLVIALIQKLDALSADSSALQNHIQCLKVVYLYGAEIDKILLLNGSNKTTANEQLRNRLPFTEAQSQIILAKNFQNNNNIEALLFSLLQDIDSLNQENTYYENYSESAQIALVDDPEGIYNIVKNHTSNVLPTLKDTYEITEPHAHIILEFNLHGLDDYDLIQVHELIGLITNDKISEVISLLQVVTDQDGMVILTPYFLRKEKTSRPKWNVDFSELLHLTGPTYLQEYSEVRPAITNLYELFNVSDELTVYGDNYFQRLDPAESGYRKEGDTDYTYLTNSKETIIQEECLTFLLLDQWQEGIPNPEQSETTGVAFRYESPQAEAPNAVIIATPPYRSSTDFWDMDLLANTLLETIELMQIRMISSSTVINELGQWLPSLLFEPAKDGKPLFPVREKLLHGFDIGNKPGHVSAGQLSKSELSKTEAYSIRSEKPQIGNNHEK